VEAIVDGGGRKKMRWRRMVENESDGEGFWEWRRWWVR
jgi:hypothetical protein